MKYKGKKKSNIRDNSKRVTNTSVENHSKGGLGVAKQLWITLDF